MSSTTRDGLFRHGEWYPVMRHRGPSIDGLLMSYAFHGRGDVQHPLRFVLERFLRPSNDRVVSYFVVIVEIVEMGRDSTGARNRIIGKTEQGRVMVEWNTSTQAGRVQFLTPPEKKDRTTEEASDRPTAGRPRLVIDVLRERRDTEDELRPYFEELREALSPDMSEWAMMAETRFGWALSIEPPNSGQAVFFTVDYELFPGSSYGIRVEIVEALVRPVKTS
ncbi:hypothetical protein HQ524_04185 [Candidatus Uhrbacteria bacterium]|nr:hypothetical protein [Candidatus Uhrbacteria bacterium]